MRYQQNIKKQTPTPHTHLQQKTTSQAKPQTNYDNTKCRQGWGASEALTPYRGRCNQAQPLWERAPGVSNLWAPPGHAGRRMSWAIH